LITPRLRLGEWYVISLSLAESPQGKQVKKRMALSHLLSNLQYEAVLTLSNVNGHLGDDELIFAGRILA
jgi:hypothetical protein